MIRSNEHFLLEKKPQLRGLERKELAQECILTANGSPFNFVNNKIVDVIKDADGNDDLAISPGQVGKFRRIVSKCVHEFLHKEMVSIFNSSVIFVFNIFVYLELI